MITATDDRLRQNVPHRDDSVPGIPLKPKREKSLWRIHCSGLWEQGLPICYAEEFHFSLVFPYRFAQRRFHGVKVFRKSTRCGNPAIRTDHEESTDRGRAEQISHAPPMIAERDQLSLLSDGAAVQGRCRTSLALTGASNAYHYHSGIQALHLSRKVDHLLAPRAVGPFWIVREDNQGDCATHVRKRVCATVLIKEREIRTRGTYSQIATMHRAGAYLIGCGAPGSQQH
jgi:hypothetical protein